MNDYKSNYIFYSNEKKLVSEKIRKDGKRTFKESMMR